MPVPPEAKVEVFQSPEAQAIFDAGDGGPLGTTPGMANGVWGPPIGMWRGGNMMPYFNIVRPNRLPSHLLLAVLWILELVYIASITRHHATCNTMGFKIVSITFSTESQRRCRVSSGCVSCCEFVVNAFMRR
jgi:hypothetical protein